MVHMFITYKSILFQFLDIFHNFYINSKQVIYNMDFVVKKSKHFYIENNIISKQFIH